MRNHKLGKIYNASGAQSNFGGWRSYWYHIPLKIISLFLGIFGLDFFNIKGMTFVSKTATLNHRVGNTPYQGTKRWYQILYNPIQWFPDSIVIKFWTGVMLNKVGLGNPGAEALLKTGLWQKRSKNGELYGISFMLLAGEGLDVLRKFVDLIKANKDFLGNFFIEYNKSCPNTGTEQCNLINATTEAELEMLAEIGVPVYVKVSISAAPMSFMKMLDENPNVDAIVCSNTLSYGWQPTEDFYKDGSWEIAQIQWEEMFGKKSPLKDKMYDEQLGGLSGNVLRYYNIKFLKEFRRLGMTKDFIACGGVFYPHHVDEYKEAGANAVAIGSIFSLRPWSIRSVIKRVNEIF